MPHISFRDYPDKYYRCSIRLIRICRDNRINRLADFSTMTMRDVLSLPECGATTTNQIQQMLRDNGLSFRDLQNHGNGDADIGRRNQNIVRLVESGLSYRQVGAEMGLSPSRVAQIYRSHGPGGRRESRMH